MDLELLRLANIDNLDIIHRTGKHTNHYSEAYKPAHLLGKYVLICRLIDHNFIIPYHHRPRCRYCKHYYYASHARDYSCAECALYGPKQRLSLSPADLLDLDFSYPAMCKELGLPYHPSIITILDDWNERVEEESVAKLEEALQNLFNTGELT